MVMNTTAICQGRTQTAPPAKREQGGNLVKPAICSQFYNLMTLTVLHPTFYYRLINSASVRVILLVIMLHSPVQKSTLVLLIAVRDHHRNK